LTREDSGGEAASTRRHGRKQDFLSETLPREEGLPGRRGEVTHRPELN
jgi:hypothetical protein